MKPRTSLTVRSCPDESFHLQKKGWKGCCHLGKGVFSPIVESHLQNGRERVLPSRRGRFRHHSLAAEAPPAGRVGASGSFRIDSSCWTADCGERRVEERRVRRPTVGRGHPREEACWSPGEGRERALPS